MAEEIKENLSTNRKSSNLPVKKTEAEEEAKRAWERERAGKTLGEGESGGCRQQSTTTKKREAAAGPCWGSWMGRGRRREQGRERERAAG
ncbi:hypothetical protein Droror1_Dr00027437 [Drosera rotundifolia]